MSIIILKDYSPTAVGDLQDGLSLRAEQKTADVKHSAVVQCFQQGLKGSIIKHTMQKSSLKLMFDYTVHIQLRNKQCLKYFLLIFVIHISRYNYIQHTYWQKIF